MEKKNNYDYKYIYVEIFVRKFYNMKIKEKRMEEWM